MNMDKKSDDGEEGGCWHELVVSQVNSTDNDSEQKVACGLRQAHGSGTQHFSALEVCFDGWR